MITTRPPLSDTKITCVDLATIHSAAGSFRGQALDITFQLVSGFGEACNLKHLLKCVSLKGSDFWGFFWYPQISLQSPTSSHLCVLDDVQCLGSSINMRQPSGPLSPCGNWKAVSMLLFQWRWEQRKRGYVRKARKAIESGWEKETNKAWNVEWRRQEEGHRAYKPGIKCIKCYEVPHTLCWGRNH